MGDLDKVSRGVFRRKQGELGRGGRSDEFHLPFKIPARKSIHLDSYWGFIADPSDFGLFHIGHHPLLLWIVHDEKGLTHLHDLPLILRLSGNGFNYRYVFIDP